MHLRIGPRLWQPHRNKKFSFPSLLVHIPLVTSLQRLQKNEQQVKAILMAGPNAPYLTACIEKNLIVTNPGVVHRLARPAPKDGIKYGKFSIPAGVYFPVPDSLPIFLTLDLFFKNPQPYPLIAINQKKGKRTNPQLTPSTHT